MSLTCDRCLSGNHNRCANVRTCGCTRCARQRRERSKSVQSVPRAAAPERRQVRAPRPTGERAKPGPKPGAPKGSHLTQELQAQVASMLEHGHSLSETSRTFGISRDQVRTIALARGLKQPGEPYVPPAKRCPHCGEVLP